jgi:ribonuclease-3
MDDVKQVEKQIGVEFKNRDLLLTALTHRSFVNEYTGEVVRDNERLEFLGDAVLDFLTGDLLYRHFPDMPEGRLTRLRAALVRTAALAELSQQCHLGEHMRMGKGEEASGGRKRITNLCAVFEAVVGALYLDQGLDAVRQFVVPLFMPLLERVLAESLDQDARSLLQEWSQAHYSETPVYRTVEESGPEHEREFMVEVLIGDQVVGCGVGRSKRSAAQAAARAALHLLKQGGLVLSSNNR